MPPNDEAVRLAAFRFLEERVRLAGDEGALRRTVLERGFEYEGQRVPLLGPQGIFKPRILSSMPLPDADPLGTPSVSNGVALCRLHHAAFDRCLIGLTADCVIEVRRDVLEDSDGPMLIHGLQRFHGAALFLPRLVAQRPDRQLLEVRYDQFRRTE